MNPGTLNFWWNKWTAGAKASAVFIFGRHQSFTSPLPDALIGIPYQFHTVPGQGDLLLSDLSEATEDQGLDAVAPLIDEIFDGSELLGLGRANHGMADRIVGVIRLGRLPGQLAIETTGRSAVVGGMPVEQPNAAHIAWL